MARRPRSAASRSVPEVHPDFAPVVAAFARTPGVTSGTMMASVGLKVDGRIFAMHARGELVVKLPAPRVDALVAEGWGRRFDPRNDGRRMREWLVSSAPPSAWVALAREAHRFVKDARR